MSAISLWLVLHLSGAALVAALIIAAVIALLHRRRQWYRPVAFGLAILVGWQLTTGAWLSLLSTHSPSLGAYCRNIGLYLLVIAATLFCLYRRMQVERLKRFPLPLTLASGGIGILVAVLAALSIFGKLARL
ncbi:MAG: hypothetical protein HYY50_02640 [Candidatus Kerfeldbacteria bacterium]|nr:hypothetical protein [Candidatus Kerfeldbacteria bacterium]